MCTTTEKRCWARLHTAHRGLRVSSSHCNDLKKKTDFKAWGFEYSNRAEYKFKLSDGLAATGYGTLEGRMRWAEGGAGETLGQSLNKGVAMLLYCSAKLNPWEVRPLVWGDRLSLFQFFRKTWVLLSGPNSFTYSVSLLSSKHHFCCWVSAQR